MIGRGVGGTVTGPSAGPVGGGTGGVVGGGPSGPVVTSERGGASRGGA